MTIPATPPPAQPVSSRVSGRAYGLIGLLLAASFALLLAPPVAASDHARTVILAASGVMTLAFLYFLWLQRDAETKALIEMDVRRTHFMQAIAQGSIYFYVGSFWPGVAAWAPFVIYQLIAAFVFDFLLSVFRHNRWRLGFSIFPIVLSINLFIWFKPDYFAGQLTMVAAAILAKAFVLRTADGRRHHVFNPSALPMAATTVIIVLLFSSEYMLNTNNVVTSYLLAPHIQLFVFCVGLLSHLASGVSFISMGAVGTLFLIDRLFIAATGLPPMGDIVQPSVFIGITLLATDPVTSSKTRTGQFIYGCLYGFGIFITYVTLNHFGYPRYYDKILPVPILNFIAPYLDRIRVPGTDFLKRGVWQTTWAPAAVYAVMFLAMLPTIERSFLRRTYFLEQGTAAARSAPPGRRQPLDPELGRLVQQRIMRQCREDPTLEACHLLQAPPPRPPSRRG